MIKIQLKWLKSDVSATKSNVKNKGKMSEKLSKNVKIKVQMFRINWNVEIKVKISRKSWSIILRLKWKCQQKKI